MKIINIKIVDGEKFINEQNFETILKNSNTKYTDKDELFKLFNKVSNELDIILELKKRKDTETPVSILKYIMLIGNLSITEAQPIFDKVMED